MTELTTLDEFRAAARPGIWITVTGMASGTHIHEAACPVLKEEEFLARVVQEGAPSGRYYATPRLEEAMRMFGEVLCVPCRKRLGRGGIAAGRGNR